MNAIDEAMQRAKERMLAAPNGAPQAEILYMETDDLKIWAQWRSSLPSYFEESHAAKARLKEKIKARREKCHG